MLAARLQPILFLAGAVVAYALPVCAEAPPAGMVRIPAGEFLMGSEDFPDAVPVHRVSVKGFWIDETEVTNLQFTEFVRATGYKTLAEREAGAGGIGASPKASQGSLVFCPHGERDGWWCFVLGASWKAPLGPSTDINEKLNHPVVHVAWHDAQAYATWAGKRLPTEAEWEYAARGGLEGAEFVWGKSFTVSGRYMANTFQGDFPQTDFKHDGFAGTAPVKSYPPNGYGLYDMAGNVWEWVADWYRSDAYQDFATERTTVDPRGPASGESAQEGAPPRRVTKGGSYLCTSKYCARYRPGGRGKNEPDSGASNLGFRLVKDLDAPAAASQRTGK